VSPSNKKILISYDDFPLIAYPLIKELEKQSVDVEFFITNQNEHWINKFFYRKVNKLLRNLRLLPKGTDLFSYSIFSYKKYLENQFIKKIDAFQPDLVFCIHGQRFGEKFLSEFGTPKIGWWIEPDPDREALIKYAQPFDLYLSYDSQISDYLNKHGIRSEYQSHVADPSTFYPVQNQKIKTDILFFGNWSPWREKVLLSAYQVTKNIGLYGRSWEKKVSLLSKEDLKSIYKGKEILGRNLNIAINQSRLVLNAQRLKGKSNGLDTRFFDVLACQKLLITDAPKDIKNHFVNGEELLIYDDEIQLKSIISESLANPDLRNRISKNGFNKVTKNFTYQNLSQKILSFKLENKKIIL
jgi:spore maturation protein CgeB